MTLSVQITHHFPGFDLDVGFEAPPGVTVLFGPSGSGKTSVMRAVAGLFRPDRGQISLGGEPLHNRPPHQRRVGFIFQDARLFPHLTVRQNLTYGTRFAPAGDGPSEAHIIQMLGLAHLLDRRPANLSGG
ncbi:MAG: ATP-binding cassette domain-containing protein, partial [Pseudomonadota bacterium]